MHVNHFLTLINKQSRPNTFVNSCGYEAYCAATNTSPPSSEFIKVVKQKNFFAPDEIITAAVYFNQNLIVVWKDRAILNKANEDDYYGVVVHSSYFDESTLHYYTATGVLKALPPTYHTIMPSITPQEVR